MLAFNLIRLTISNIMNEPSPFCPDPSVLERRSYGTPCPGVPELSALRAIFRADATRMPPHLHPGQIEITFIQRGRVNWWVGEEALELTGGDLYVTQPEEPHGSVTGAIEPVMLYGVTLRLPEAGGSFLRLPASEADALVGALRVLPRRFRAGSEVAESFRRARAARLMAPSELNAAALRGRLVALLTDIVASTSGDEQTTAACRQIEIALSLMQEHLDQPLDLEAIAEAVGWSVGHFKVRFRRETGTTPARHHLRLRVLEGVRRIATTGESVTQVAHALGFSSSQYFATCVRRIIGRTPRTFVKKSH
ncbi:MAG: AraC family transcriptional regulator [Planctomycetota bacterium]